MHVHVGRGCRVLQRLLDVSALQVRVLGKDLLERPARGDQPDPRMQGLPSSLSGSTVMRSNAIAVSPLVVARLSGAGPARGPRYGAGCSFGEVEAAPLVPGRWVHRAAICGVFGIEALSNGR